MSKSLAKIKDIYIQLKGYQFHHTPYEDGDDEVRFIGRTKVKEKIKTLLNESVSKSGTYLVTGFRGMGKTSLVRQAVEEVNGMLNCKLERFLGKLNISVLLEAIIKSIIIYLVFASIYTFLFVRADYFACFFEDDPKRDFDINIKIIVSLLGIILSIDILINSLIPYINDNRRIRKIPITIPLIIIGNIIIINILFFLYDKGHNTLFLLIWGLALIIYYGIWNYKIKKYPIKFILLNKFWKLNKVFSLCFIVCYFAVEGYTDLSFSYKEEKFYSYICNFVLSSQSYIFSGDILLRKAVSLVTHLVLCGILILGITLIYDVFSSIWQYFITFRRKKYHRFEINLSQESLSERDLLKRINDKLIGYWEENEKSISGIRFNRRIYWPFKILLKAIGSRLVKNKEGYDEILDRLYGLRNRISGSVSIQKDSEGSPDFYAEIERGFSKLVLPFGKSTDKNTINYPIANSKEAEDELIKIFELIDAYKQIKNIPDFVFIVDELDKIDPQYNSITDDDEYSNPSSGTFLNSPASRPFQKRQEAVASLLASLKGFLNVVKAKFFFIGGRELFDADLADTADRDSFYSSIFNAVFYVSSFYKDTIPGTNKDGVTTMIEAFLMNIVLNDLTIESKADEKPEDLNLERLAEWMMISGDCLNIKKTSFDEGFNEKKLKIISTLQNYITYLFYRSNGSPKKLTALVEKCIVKIDQKELEKTDTEKFNWKEFTKNNIVVTQGDAKDTSGLYLRLSYNTQYEVNFTADLFRPYMIYNSRYMKSLGDKLLFSTPFIFDHIMKFHAFGFSWRNIELIPEVILPNKEPHLREHVRSILAFMGNYLVKDTASGLYDYRFHSLVRKEVSILSKTSDLAAAAFNFTLDESLLVKRHYKRKLVELEEKYRGYQPIEGDNQFVHSIHFLQVILGSLYFYDKDYGVAVEYFTEAIQTLRLPKAIDARNITRHQFLLWQTTKLRLGLTLEKIEAYESAVSYYRTLMIDSKRYLEKFTVDETNNKRYRIQSRNNISESETHRAMQTLIMPHIALLAVLEKNRADGLNYKDLYDNIKELKALIDPGSSNPGDNKHTGAYRKGFLWGDYYSNVGSILFYKNCQFTEFFTEKTTALFKYERSQKYYLDKINESDNTWLKIFYESLHDQQNKESTSANRAFDFYPSSTSITYYMNSLAHFTDYHLPRIEEGLPEDIDPKWKANNINPLHVCALYLHGDFVDMINARRFYYLANVVSKLGDAIFASISDPVVNDMEGIILNIQQLDHLLDLRRQTDPSKQKLFEMILENFEIKNKESFFSFRTVFFIYYLASELYKRSGQTYYYSFSQKKMLYLLKEMVGCDRSLICEGRGTFKEYKGYDLKTGAQVVFTLQKIDDNEYKVTYQVNITQVRNKHIFSIDIRDFVPEKMYIESVSLSDDEHFKLESEFFVKSKQELDTDAVIGITFITNQDFFIEKKIYQKAGEESVSFVITAKNESQGQLDLKNVTVHFENAILSKRLFKLDTSNCNIKNINDSQATHPHDILINQNFYSTSNNFFNPTQPKLESGYACEVQGAFKLAKDVNVETLLYQLEQDVSLNFIATYHIILTNEKSGHDVPLDGYCIDLPGRIGEGFIKVVKNLEFEDTQGSSHDINTNDEFCFNDNLTLFKSDQNNILRKGQSITLTISVKVKQAFFIRCCKRENIAKDYKGNKLIKLKYEITNNSEVNSFNIRYLKILHGAYLNFESDIKTISSCVYDINTYFRHVVIHDDRIEIKAFELGKKSIYTFEVNLRVAFSTCPNLSNIVNDYAQSLAINVVKASLWYNEISQKPMITKYRNILKINAEDEKNKKNQNIPLYNAVNNNADVREAILCTETIRMKMGIRSDLKLCDTDKVSSRYVRMLELKFHAEQMYRDYKPPGSFDTILEALFAIRECIILIQLYDPGYIIGYSYLASAHDWAADWCEKFADHCKDLDDAGEGQRKKLEALIGKNSMLFLDINYHREAAVQNYQKVLQMHSEGEAYKDKALGLYMLEDDFNDNLTHFHIAMERFLVNTGDIREKIQKLQEKIKESRMYEYNNYAP